MKKKYLFKKDDGIVFIDESEDLVYFSDSEKDNFDYGYSRYSYFDFKEMDKICEAWLKYRANQSPYKKVTIGKMTYTQINNPDLDKLKSMLSDEIKYYKSRHSHHEVKGYQIAGTLELILDALK